MPVEVDLISEKQGCKRDALVANGTGRIKMILSLSTEVVALYVEGLIV